MGILRITVGGIMKRLLLPGLSLVCLLAVAGRAQAAAIQYDNRADFEAAAGGVQTETFDAITDVVVFDGTPYDVGAFSITGTDSIVLGIDPTPGSLFTVNGTPYVVGIGQQGEDMVFTFDARIFAFGVDMVGINDFDTENTRVIVAGVTYQLPLTSGFGDASFFGVVSDTPFTTVTFRAIEGEAAGLDNISFANAPSAVPEPTSIALVASGLAGVLLRRRRTA
jgi:hypothetical protein